MINDPALGLLKFPKELVKERLYTEKKTEEIRLGIKHHYLVEQAAVQKKKHCTSCQKELTTALDRM